MNIHCLFGHDSRWACYCTWTCARCFKKVCIKSECANCDARFNLMRGELVRKIEA